MQGDLFINAILLPRNNLEYSPGRITIESKERALDGTLLSDLIAIKKKFSLVWTEHLDEDFTSVMTALYEAKADVTFTEVQSDLTTKVWTCSMDICEEMLRGVDFGSYSYSGFTIALEEV